MVKRDISVNQAELVIPLKFLDEVIRKCSTDTSETRWKGSETLQDDGFRQIDIVSRAENGYLSLWFDWLHFKFVKEAYTCKFNGVELNVDHIKVEDDQTKDVKQDDVKLNITQDDELGHVSAHKVDAANISSSNHQRSLNDENFVQTKTTQPNVKAVKRKRGRPPKTKQSDKINGSYQSGNIKISAENSISEELDAPQLTHLLDSAVGKRYALRGVKLNTAIMDAVKGLAANADIFSEVKNQDDVPDASHGDTTEDGNNICESQANETADKEDFDQVEIKEEKDADDSDFEPENNSKRNKDKEKSSSMKENVNTCNNKVEDIANTNLDNFEKDLPKFERKKRVFKGCVCKICNRKLMDYTGVYEHVKKMHKHKKGVEEYLQELDKLKVEECGICGKSFQDRCKLGIHENREHRKNVPVDCFKCKKTFKHIYSLKNHIRTMHIGEKQRLGLCHLCSASFRSVASLQQHIDEIHYGNKHVQCDKCNKKFYNRSQLKRHSRIHGLDESKRLFCRLCNKSFLYQHNLRRHMLAVHSTSSETFHCSYCGKGFNQKTGMISHVQLVHFNLFPFSCQLCKAIFARSLMLKDHMTTYHKQPDFHIDPVPRNKIYNKSVEEMFYCSYCRNGFHNKTKLVEHMHTDHSDAFPYSCKTCSQGFLEKSFLIIHRLKSHGEWIQDDNEITEKDQGKVSKIMQYISTKAGGSSRIVTVNSREDPGDSAVNEQSHIEGVPAEESQPIEPAEAGSSSLLVEVASGDSTYRYVIEAPGTLGETGSVTVAQDIAQLLLAAEHSIQQGDGSTIDSDSSDIREINLVINDLGGTQAENPGTSETADIAPVLTASQHVVDTEEMEYVEDGTQSGNQSISGMVPRQDGMIEIQMVDSAGNLQVMNVGEPDSGDSHEVDILQLAAIETVGTGKLDQQNEAHQIQNQ